MSDDFLSGLQPGSNSDEDFPHITEDWLCSECGAEIDIELIKTYDLQIERSGVSPGYDFAPAVYWFEGNIACPGCGVRLDYDDRSG